GPRRVAGLHLTAAAILGVRRHGPGECHLGAIRAARIVARRPARALLLEERASAWGVAAASLTSGVGGACLGILSDEPGARRAAEYHGPVHALSLRLGYAGRGHSAGGRRFFGTHRPGSPRETSGRLAQGAACIGRWPGFRSRR